MATDTSNVQFQLAARFVHQTSRHIFLTGKAGTGKTTFLRYLKDSAYKKMAIVAPTGVAAMNAGGMTIHSFFNLPFGTYIHNKAHGWGEENGNVYNKHQLFHKAKLSGAKRSIIREIELLVIDEVSMVRADVLDAMDAILRNIRKRQEPFGGVQLLFIGDLFQLPPVVKEEDWNHLREVYASPFFFDALVLREADPVSIELDKIYRQQDRRFVDLLNNVRNNCCTTSDYDLLRDHYQPAFTPVAGDDFITLTSHNFKADAINKQELDKLPGKPVLLEALVTGDFPEHTYPADRVLALKQGAQVMFIKNDKGEARRYFNGKIGLIEKIDLVQDQIQVRFPHEPDLLTLEKETWRNIRYQFDAEKDRITEDELGTFTQYPIRTAWAVTIHKSQGLTFQKAMIDAGRSFAPGQVYVALSRLTNMEGLVLKSPIEANSISTDPHVLAFSQRTIAQNALLELLESAQKAFAGKSILQVFDWSKLREEVSEFLAAYEKRVILNKEKGYILFLDISRVLMKLQEVGARFTAQLQQLLQDNGNEPHLLKERATAATIWFNAELEQKILSPLQLHYAEMRNKPRTKKYLDELRDIQLQFEKRQRQLNQVNVIVQSLAEEKDMESLMEEVSKLHRPLFPQTAMEASSHPADPKPVKVPKGETKRISLALFKEGKSIPEIAKERALAVTTIEGHIAAYAGTSEIDIHTIVTAEKLNAIAEKIRALESFSLSAVKEQLDDSFTYFEIKCVAAYIRFQEAGNTS